MEEPTSPPAPDLSDPRIINRTRFELELEFVQSLANPFYLQTLGQQRILDDPAFINYLAYLKYWSEKEYASYPHALHHLELLQHAQFRQEVKKDEWREYLNQKQFDHWRTWRDPSYLQGIKIDVKHNLGTDVDQILEAAASVDESMLSEQQKGSVTL
ncbi:hypothetical protein HWV62_28403 [Athelia sp. TMB]|nr:hypothetical protein HWV62_28403 [Athelia sp. TMB]